MDEVSIMRKNIRANVFAQMIVGHFPSRDCSLKFLKKKKHHTEHDGRDVSTRWFSACNQRRTA